MRDSQPDWLTVPHASLSMLDRRSQTPCLVDTWTEVDGRQTFARTANGPIPTACRPVVLVHGFGVSSRYLVPTAVRLAPYFHVYAPDLPGFGRSARPPNALDVWQLADTLAHWMVAVGIERASLLANSFGCQVIADLALRYPTLADRLVFVGPTFAPWLRNPVRLARAVLSTVLHEPISLSLLVDSEYLKAGIRRDVQTFRFMLRDHLEGKLPRLGMPTLVVRGEHDAIAPQPWIDEVVRLLPNGRAVVIPGAGHAVNYDAPEKLVHAILPFLGGSCRGA